MTAAALTSQRLASDLFRAMCHEEPPPARPWRLVARPHTGNPAQPIFDIDPREPWVVNLNLHDGQMRAWESEARFVFMFAGTQAGKTSLLAWLKARRILRDMFANPQRGGDYLVVTATWDLYKLNFLPALREVLEYTLGIARYHPAGDLMELADPLTGEFTAKRQSDPMWGRVILRSANSKSGLESATIRAAVLDECGQDAFTWSAWSAIRRRISLSRGQVWGGTTLFNLGWLKQKIHDPWVEGKAPDVDIIQFPSNINPLFDDEEFEEARRSLQRHEFMMQYQGVFTRPAGAIYGDFVALDRDEGGHLAKRFLIPSDWPRAQGVDPGIINTARLWAAHDPDRDVWYVYRCLHGKRRPATEHARDDLAIESDAMERVIMRAVGNRGEIYWREDYQAAGATGLRAPSSDNVEEGIDRVLRMIRQHRLYIFDDLHELVDEMLSYSRATNDMGDPTFRIQDKAGYHRLDALRYLCMQIGPERPNIRPLVAQVMPYA